MNKQKKYVLIVLALLLMATAIGCSPQETNLETETPTASVTQSENQSENTEQIETDETGEGITSANRPETPPVEF